MIFSTLFEYGRRIETEQFIADWRAEEQGKSDGWTNDRIAEAEASSKLNYHIVHLTEAGLYQLALPAHSHPDRIVEIPDTPLRDVLPMYVERHQKTLRCLSQRIDKIVGELDEHFEGKRPNYRLGRVSFQKCGGGISDNQVARDRLYTCNFHRFIAYGVWVARNDFRPIDCYLIENPAL